MTSRWLRGQVLKWHGVVLGTGAGERTKTVIRGLAWTAPAAFASRISAGVATMLAARLMEPAEFGRANVSLAATLFMQLPLLLSVPTAVMHYVPAAEGEDRRSAWAGTGLLLVALCGGATLVAVLTLMPVWAALSGLDPAAIRLALTWCAGFLPYAVTTSVLAARERFGRRALVESVFAVLYPLAVALLWWHSRLNGTMYVTSLAAAYAVAGGAGILASLPFVTFRSPGFGDRARKLLSYGLLASGSVLATASLQGTARLVASRCLQPVDVGILSAYQAGSIQMAMYAVTLVAGVFIPIASRTPSREALLRKITRLLVPVTVGSAVVYGGVLAACFRFLGHHYPLHAREWAAFSLAAGLLTCQWLVLWYLYSAGAKGVLAASLAMLLAGGVNTLACSVWIPRFGVMGAALAMSVGQIAGIAACYLPWIRRAGGAAEAAEAR